jgi:hypothetical protein
MALEQYLQVQGPWKKPLRLNIPQKRRDVHFPTAPATTGSRSNFHPDTTNS